jgi:hypothetical protein
LIENLSKFFQKIDGLPNVYTPLREMDDQNYLELAIRTAFPEGREQIGGHLWREARKGYEIVKYHKDGKVQALEVTRDIARAIQGLTPGSSSLLVRTMQMAAMPLKLGATGMNAAFQPVNLLFADLPRAAFVSRYGIRNMKDLFKFPADYLYSFFTAVKGNFGHPNDLYKQLLDGGALNSTIQRELTPGVFDPTSFQKSFGKKYVLEALPRLANAIEETGKTVGFKRALRLDEIAKMGPDQADEAIKRIVTEVRNFSGSPDFLRRGQAAAGSNIANLNLLFMFFNARIQGSASDLARLTGKAEGGGRAAAMAWKRMSAAVGAPALTLAVYNHLPWNREDYDKVPLWERENYFMIPRFDRWGRAQYFTNDQGERIRDYWRIPKREITGLYGNMIEAGVKFAIDRNLETISLVRRGVPGEHLSGHHHRRDIRRPGAVGHQQLEPDSQGPGRTGARQGHLQEARHRAADHRGRLVAGSRPGREIHEAHAGSLQADRQGDGSSARSESPARGARGSGSDGGAGHAVSPPQGSRARGSLDLAGGGTRRGAVSAVGGGGAYGTDGADSGGPRRAGRGEDQGEPRGGARLGRDAGRSPRKSNTGDGRRFTTRARRRRNASSEWRRRKRRGSGGRRDSSDNSRSRTESGRNSSPRNWSGCPLKRKWTGSGN